MTMHEHPTTSKNLILAISLNILIVTVEIVFGLLTRSMALISDALHNVSDVGAMVLSLWGEKVSDRPATDKKTYGYKRVEALIAFINSGVLLGVVVFILIESLLRVFNPEPVASLVMLVVASMALIGNGIATVLLQAGARKNLNLKSAWMHSAQDALFSLGVIVGAAIIYVTDWNWLDPLVSIVISLLLLKGIIVILRDSVNMLLDSVPKDLDFVKVKKRLLALPGIVMVDDLHIWQTGTDNRMLSAHLIIAELNATQRLHLITDAQTILKEYYLIDHVTFQMVSVKEFKTLGLVHEHCN
jgi:cobalt-zinc-cadmium efflux system protein